MPKLTEAFTVEEEEHIKNVLNDAARYRSLLRGKFKDELACSFCGTGQSKIKKLIAGPDVYICDECVNLCTEILSGMDSDKDGDETE